MSFGIAASGLPQLCPQGCILPQGLYCAHKGTGVMRRDHQTAAALLRDLVERRAGKGSCDERPSSAHNGKEFAGHSEVCASGVLWDKVDMAFAIGFTEL